MATAPESFIEPRVYLELERTAQTKSEYIDGRILAMAGASEKHNLILSNLIVSVGPQLRGHGCRIYPSDLKVKVGNRYFYPDASVVCGPVEYADDERDVIQNPAVLFEILSPSSAAYDRGVKFLSYQNIESLREYVLISQDELLVEVFRRHRESSWIYSKSQSEREVIRLEHSGFELKLSELYLDVL